MTDPGCSKHGQPPASATPWQPPWTRTLDLRPVVLGTQLPLCLPGREGGLSSLVSADQTTLTSHSQWPAAAVYTPSPPSQWHSCLKGGGPAGEAALSLIARPFHLPKETQRGEREVGNGGLGARAGTRGQDSTPAGSRGAEQEGRWV